MSSGMARYLPPKGYPASLVFPLKWGMTMIAQGPFDGERTAQDLQAATHGMAVNVHPGQFNERLSVHNTDIYLVGASGSGECMQRTPKQIFGLN